MFVTPAWAQSATDAATSATPQGGGLIGFFVPMFLILLVFYFFVFRPQNKRMREHGDMVNNLKRGDRVVTGGGLIGKVYKLAGEDEVIIDLAEGVRVHAVRSTILTIREKAVSYAAAGDSSDTDDGAKSEKAITVSRVRESKKKREEGAPRKSAR